MNNCYNYAFSIQISSFFHSYIVIPPCDPNPCQHSGRCIAVSTVEYTCDCSSTHYKGVNCEIGIVTFPSIPILTTNQTSEVLYVTAYPDQSINITFLAPTSLLIRPNYVIFISGYPNAAFAITATQPGRFQLTYRISGLNAARFEEPQSFYVLVLEPTTPHTPNNYFTQLGLKVGLLAPGCCTPMSFRYQCPFRTSTVSFPSTCMWSTNDSGDHLTNGVVFTSGSGLNLPLSIVGTELSISNALIQNKLPNSNPTCIDCGGTDPSCYHYEFKTNDIVDLLHSQALAKTYFNYSRDLLPTWLSFDIGNATLPASASFFSSDYSTTLVHGDQVRFISGCERLQVDRHGLYSILRYHSNLTVLSNSDQYDFVPNTLDAPICFAVDICSGSSSPVHITIPPSSLDNLSFFNKIQQYTSKGWELMFTEALVSRFGVSPPMTSPTLCWNGASRVTMSVPKFDLRLRATMRKTLVSDKLWINFDFSGGLYHWADPTVSQVSIINRTVTK